MASSLLVANCQKYRANNVRYFPSLSNGDGSEDLATLSHHFHGRVYDVPILHRAPLASLGKVTSISKSMSEAVLFISGRNPNWKALDFPHKPRTLLLRKTNKSRFFLYLTFSSPSTRSHSSSHNFQRNILSLSEVTSIDLWVSRSTSSSRRLLE